MQSADSDGLLFFLHFNKTNKYIYLELKFFLIIKSIHLRNVHKIFYFYYNVFVILFLTPFFYISSISSISISMFVSEVPFGEKNETRLKVCENRASPFLVRNFLLTVEKYQIIRVGATEPSKKKRTSACFAGHSIQLTSRYTGILHPRARRLTFRCARYILQAVPYPSPETDGKAHLDFCDISQFFRWI